MFGRRDARDVLIEQLMKQNADLLDRLQETIGQIHYHQVKAHEAKSELPPPPSALPLNVSEHEEDAVAMATRPDGTVDEQMLAELLAEAGFADTEIHFA